MARRKGKKSNNSRVRRAAERVIIACLAVIVAFSGWKIYTILHDYKQQQDIYDDLAGDTLDIDFDALRKINPDVVGWIYYEDSPINYPIVQGTDNETYLSKLFDGTWGGFGTIFVDAETETPFRQFNTIVYGHHMRNGSMFACLGRLKDTGYVKEHPRLELITPGGKYHLEVWAFLNQPADSAIYRPNISLREDRQAYLDLVTGLSDYITSTDVSTDDRLVELSTCAYEYQDARYVVVCKMVPW